MKRIAELQAFVAGNAPGDDTATLELSRTAAVELLADIERSRVDAIRGCQMAVTRELRAIVDANKKSCVRLTGL